MILIIDKELKTNQLDLLNKFCSVYEIDVKYDYEKKIKDLPQVDIYVVNISRCECFGRSYGIRFLETNYDTKLPKIYYRKTGIIKKYNLERLNSKIIKSFPNIAGDQQDLLNRLNHNSLPHTNTGVSFCLKWVWGRICKTNAGTCIWAFFSCS